MTFSISFLKKAKSKSETLVLPVFENTNLSMSAKNSDQELGGLISECLKNNPAFNGKSGDTFTIPITTHKSIKRIVLLGFGKPSSLDETSCETLGGKLLSFIETQGCENICLQLGPLDDIHNISSADIAARIALSLIHI